MSGGKSFPQIARSGFQSQLLLSSPWCQVTGFLYMEKNERGEVVVREQGALIPSLHDTIDPIHPGPLLVEIYF